MLTSPEINEISAALSKAQGEMDNAVMDKINPHYKSKFASLRSGRDASRAALAKYDLAIVQTPVERKVDDLVGVTTRLCHKSGQFFQDTAWAKPKSWAPQDVGSATSYLRRYGRAAMLDQVSEEDDDGESTTTRVKDNRPEGNVRDTTTPPAPAPTPTTALTGETLYDGSTEHQTALSERLKSKKVPELLWDDINSQMQGKPLKTWPVVAEAVRQDFIAKQIPF